MTERENILGRIREALKEKVHIPGRHGQVATSTATSIPRQWLPKVGETFDEQLALFARNTAELKADFQLFNSAEEIRQAIIRLRDAEGWRRVAGHSGDLTNAICPALSLPLLRRIMSPSRGAINWWPICQRPLIC